MVNLLGHHNQGTPLNDPTSFRKALYNFRK